MKDTRSTSQILFGFLPNQTVDLQGDVWKVREWRNPLVVSNVDDETLRRELLRLVQPWETGQNDNYLGRMLRRKDPIRVIEVSPENGVDVEPFPPQWVCRRCKRLHAAPDASCPCGAQALSSFHFVGYHDQCGALKQVPLPRPCPKHGQLAVRFPGASASSELRFVCPLCDAVLRKGFPLIPCTCGKPGNLAFNVHRAAAVFTPRTVVVVNAPRAEHRQAIAQAGGRSRALSWYLDGMPGQVTDTPATEESLRQTLLAQNLPKAVIDALVAQAQAAGGLSDQGAVHLREDVRHDAEDQAVSVALASLNSRLSLVDLQNSVPGMSSRGALYRDRYPPAIRQAGLESVDLMDRFPILTGVFGFTRGEYTPGESALVPFKNAKGGIDLHADFTETEALFFRLDPVRVAAWLLRRGWPIGPYSDARSARLQILELCKMPEGFDRGAPSPDQDLFMLVHSYAHRTMRIGAKFAGIDRNALAELLVPLHLGFFVYASARGDFVLGGLQAVFESRLHDLLQSIVHDERRCAMDPGCSKGGGACPACLHVGEPSCRWFNQLLDRDTLFGENGFLRRHSHSTANDTATV